MMHSNAFRADRARELTQALTQENFDGFERKVQPKISRFVCLTQYHADFGLPVAYPPTRPDNVLGKYLADLGKKQLRIAETEKYAHVTFFFSGGQEDPYEGERRILIPSPKVSTYDQCPEMSARKVTDELVSAIRSRAYDVIICNYANGDMVGHTGNFDAAVQAVETLDACLGRLEKAVEEAGGGTFAMEPPAAFGGPYKLKEWRTGEVIIREGETSDSLYVVLSGELAAVKRAAAADRSPGC